MERFLTATVLILGVTLFAINPALAQTAEQTIVPREITGVVQDPVTKVAIEGAKVSIYTVDQVLATVSTGTNPVITPASGAYSFAVIPGVYRIEVEKEGYVKSILSQTLPSGDTSAYFYTTQPSTTANLPLVSEEDSGTVGADGAGALYVNPDGTLTTECKTPPVVDDVFPIPNSKVKNLFPTIQFTLKKGDPAAPGLDRNCVKMFINDKEVIPTITGTEEELTVTYKPTDPVGAETNVRIEACDKSKTPNKIIKEFVFYSDTGSLYSSPEIDAKYSQMNKLTATGTTKYTIFAALSLMLAGAGLYVWQRRKNASS